MDLDLKGLIARLNPVCRQGLEEAAALCVTYGHFHIEIEHILLKVLAQKSTDLHAMLSHYDIEPETVVDELTRALERMRMGNKRVPTFAPSLGPILTEAWMLGSIQLGMERVRSSALLIAARSCEAIREQINASAPSLRRLRINLMLEEAEHLIGDTVEAVAAAERAPAAPAEKAPRRVSQHTPHLNQYTVDLTARARAGKIDPIVGREVEIRQAIDILTRRRQNNPILVGEAGVGKTAIAEGLALRIAKANVPPMLRSVQLRTLDLALLQAGAGVAGEFEKRLKKVIEEVHTAAEPVILFIDEAHTLIGAGGAAGQTDAANLLKPALARGELRTIAATTWSEYKRFFETDSALARRFQLVKVEEPDSATAIAMLRGLVPSLQDHHLVRVLDEAVQGAVRLSQRYLTGRRLPDKAISVIDTACARVSVAQRSTPEAVQTAMHRAHVLREEAALLEDEQAARGDHRERLDELHRALEAAEEALRTVEARWHDEQDIIRKIQRLEESVASGAKRAPEVQERGQILRTSLANLQGDDPLVPLDVDAVVVASVISDWTGIPAHRMRADQVATVLGLEDALGERVLGQAASLEAICRRMRTAWANLGDPDKPVGVFLLAGPSGVGKTETAAALASALFGGERAQITINMSEYQEAHTVSQLKGAPPGYVGHGRGGVLTEAVRRQPYSVILLDEVEKAHPDVLELFYQVFDKGVMEDGEGVVIDFKNTVILLTTNVAGAEILDLCRAEQRPQPQLVVEAIQPVLRARFSDSLLGRMVVVPYFPLRKADLTQIAELKLSRAQSRFFDRQGAALHLDDDVVESIVEGCQAMEVGARNIDNALTQSVLPALSSVVLELRAAGEPVGAMRILSDPLGGFVVVPESEADAARSALRASAKDLKKTAADADTTRQEALPLDDSDTVIQPAAAPAAEPDANTEITTEVAQRPTGVFAWLKATFGRSPAGEE